MNASARGTASDYSKGSWLRRPDLPVATLALAALALGGALLLLAADLSALYTVVVGSLETERRSVSGAANHGHALMLAAAGAVAMTAAALRGSRTAAAALVALGAVALLIALVIDLPDTRASGTLPEAVAFSQAHAKAAAGFTLEIAGGVALLLAGAGLLVPGRAQSRKPSSRNASSKSRSSDPNALNRDN